LVADYVTKNIAVARLSPPFIPHDVFGSYGRLTLTFNRGMALGISFGVWSRPFLILVAVVMIGGLLYFYNKVAPDDRLYAASLGLILGGALGNLLDRLRGTRGVVDFIDIGVGSIRFWTFNVADIGVTIGTVLLAFVVWQREREQETGDRRAAPRV
jgi:signal peptidase II